MPTSRRRAPWPRRAALIPLILALAGVGQLLMAAPVTAQGNVSRGATLYGTSCALCHGENARGSDDGPSLIGVGAASVDFMLRTGRMPLEDPDEPMRRGPQQVSDADREALVAWIASLSEGPEIPDVSGIANADLARGLELFTSNCAACHGPTAAGVAVGQRDVSSDLDVAEPIEIAEAIRTGPGVMPVFGEELIDDQDLQAITAWVLDLRERAAPGGAAIGRSGPVTEGFVAWLVGFGLLTIVMYLLGDKATDDEEGEDG
ncbi:MAG: c-type cytochrome [Nitriliruptorales bacterium]|nr:c-type cytochrome [Nitriliruptorales bacterium]